MHICISNLLFLSSQEGGPGKPARRHGVSLASDRGDTLGLESHWVGLLPPRTCCPAGGQLLLGIRSIPLFPWVKTYPGLLSPVCVGQRQPPAGPASPVHTHPPAGHSCISPPSVFPALSPNPAAVPSSGSKTPPSQLPDSAGSLPLHPFPKTLQGSYCLSPLKLAHLRGTSVQQRLCPWNPISVPGSAQCLTHAVSDAACGTDQCLSQPIPEHQCARGPANGAADGGPSSCPPDHAAVGHI